jgi:hypothetical protein
MRELFKKVSGFVSANRISLWEKIEIASLGTGRVNVCRKI